MEECIEREEEVRDENEALKVEVGSYDNDGSTVGPIANS